MHGAPTEPPRCQGTKVGNPTFDIIEWVNRFMANHKYASGPFEPVLREAFFLALRAKFNIAQCAWPCFHEPTCATRAECDARKP
jgi:hypothetical protein